MAQYILAGISGSLRTESSNTLLVREAARAFDPAEFLMGDIRLPLFDEDLEAAGIPDEVTALADLISRADALVIATPEYNKNLPGGLKNALDWMSRVKPNPLNGKPVAIVSAAAGRAGGERAQYSLRHCLTPHFARVLNGPEVMIAGANRAFDDAGHLSDPMSFEFLGKLMTALKAEIHLLKH